MTLTINRDETYRFVQELDHPTRESATVAVAVAVRERLDQVRLQQRVSLADQVLAIGEDCAAHLKEPYPSSDHADLLDHECGLPR